MPPTTQTRRRSGGLLKWGVLVLPILAAYFLTPIALGWAGSWLNVGDRLHTPVDYVYVLGGEANTRPFLAAAIYRAGYAREVLIPEGHPIAFGEENTSLSDHELQRAILLKRGVPALSIRLLPGPVDNTRDESLALATFLKSSPQSRVAIVTSDFHTRRTRLTFRRNLPRHQGELYFVACPTDGFGPNNWWHYKDGVLWYVMEYAKLIREQLW